MESLVCGGQSRWRGNAVRYALDRWGNRTPKTGLRALVIGGADPGRVMTWLADIPGLAGVTLITGATNEDLTEEFTLPGLTVEEKNWDGLAADGTHHLAIADYAFSRLTELAPRLQRLEDALTPGGLLVVRDYVGPARYQFTDGQMRVVNAILPLLPEIWRRDVSGTLRVAQEPPPVAWVMNNDPLAAVASTEVRAAVTAGFNLVEEASLGGTVLMPLMAGISHNFLDPSPECQSLLDALWSAEQTLLEAKLLPADHWFAVAAKRPGKQVGSVSDGRFIDRDPVM